MEWYDRFAMAVSTAHIQAILIGLVISLGVTQIVKNAPSLGRMEEKDRTFYIRLIAFFLAFVPTSLWWPGSITQRILIGLAVGGTSPVLYKVGAKALYHYFPWLEPKMSAKPLPVTDIPFGDIQGHDK